ncbi:hypothetical protein SAY87_004806 [Trapa incisa]|uniref:Pentatricopeptide repeat-containing protein n=1 Tax=Trapa incisa TaxID=236973 RepID=A0AAN7PN79_9MYRT|nr:hypothetical protein SAY87_004806 [Trapa incisa]
MAPRKLAFISPPSVFDQLPFDRSLATSLWSSASPQKFASFLDNCWEFNSLKKLHARIFVLGLGGEIFLGTKLVSSYAKFRTLSESRWVFRGIVNDNLSLWNSVIVGYFRANQFQEVLGGYLALRRRRIGLNSPAVTFSLKSCVGLESLGFGRGVHCDAFKFGLEGDPFVGSALIGLYSKLGAIEDAAKSFDEISERDTVAYTSMITAFSQCGGRLSCKAFHVFGYMQRNQVDPSRVTLVSLLQAAASLGELNAGQAIHGFALRRRIGCSDEVFETALMDMYIRCGGLKMASRVFRPKKVRTVGSWNALITGYLQIGQPVEALQHFICMICEKVVPDLISLANALLACADLVCMKEGKSIHGYIFRAGMELDTVASTALLGLYCKCGGLGQARQIYNQIDNKDVITHNVMMGGYVRDGLAREAIEMYSHMIRTGQRPNSASLLTVLSALSDHKDVKTCLPLHGRLIRSNLESNTEIANHLISTYARCSFLHYARRVFNRIARVDLVSLTSMMTGYVLAGHADEAVSLLKDMQQEILEHDSVALTTVLQAFSQLGCLSSVKEVHCRLYRSRGEADLPFVNSLITTYAKCGRADLAGLLFHSTSSQCLTTWNAMIAAHGMHGNPEEAMKLYNEMKVKGIRPDGATFTSILTACSHSGLVQEGLCVFKSMYEEHGLHPQEEHYSCLVDLLCRSGKLAEACEVLRSIPLLDESSSAKGSLLAACRVYADQKRGEAIGRELLDSESGKPSLYTAISNLYAQGERWEEAGRLRSVGKDRCERTPGYSLIEVQ